MIQYSRALAIESRSRGVLDTPLSRGMTVVNTVCELEPGTKYSVSMIWQPQSATSTALILRSALLRASRRMGCTPHGSRRARCAPHHEGDFACRGKCLTDLTEFLIRQPHIVLRQRGCRRLRTHEIIQFSELDSRAKTFGVGKPMQHRGHPPREAHRLPDPRQRLCGIAVDPGGRFFIVIFAQRVGAQ